MVLTTGGPITGGIQNFGSMFTSRRMWVTELTVKSALRQRMVNAKQGIVLVGEKTKNLYRFVRWEIELAIEKDLPIVVVNLRSCFKIPQLAR
jgi:hypothetical protein